MVEIKIPQILFTIVNVLVLYAALAHFLFKPVREFLGKREEHVKKQLAEAEESRVQAAQLAEEYEQKLAAAKEEARHLIETATKQAQRSGSEIEAAAQEQAQQLLERARKEIGLERDKALASLRDEISDLAVLAAGHLLGQKMDQQQDGQLVQDFLKGMDKAHVQ
ncbi:MAG: F0F1 ATP synthase subunit B [Bacillota bacterium]|jgi:F-type H+-transporting ATPase subunit b